MEGPPVISTKVTSLALNLQGWLSEDEVIDRPMKMVSLVTLIPVYIAKIKRS